MRTSTIFLGLWIVCFGYFGAARSFAQEQEEDVRGAFLTTRPIPAQKGSKNITSARLSKRRPKTSESKPPASTDAAEKTGAPTNKSAPAKTTAQKIGLGLTLFTRDSNGLAVRADPSRVFRKGDRVRVLLETNADGYLYIFNTTDGGKPVMIYPDAELDEGGNYIRSHIPFEIPSSVAAEERLRWLTFDEHAGAERLYFVFTREPLQAVPIDDDLVNYCRESNNKCPWQLGSELWTQIQKELSVPVQVAKAQSYGRPQTVAEHEATTRGLGLSKEDPEPSLIMLRASSATGMLVTTLDLVHK